MIVPVFDFKDEVKQFVANGIWGDGRGFDKCSTIGFANETEGLVAGIIYHNYNPVAKTIEISAYSSIRNWTNKEFIKLIFWDYPFEQLQCRLAIARYSENNIRVGNIWRRLGSDEYKIPDLRSDGEAEVIAVLKKSVFEKSKFLR